MKLFFSFLLILIGLHVRAQSEKSLQVVTSVEQKSFTPQQLQNFGSQTLDSLRIYNHAGVFRSTLNGITGVALKDVLKEVSFGEKSPKILSRYYIVCEAEDGYAVVFSWNELFNTAIGDDVLVVTGIRDGGSEGGGSDLALVSPQDRATGRRYVKQLQTIKILQVSL